MDEELIEQLDSDWKATYTLYDQSGRSDSEITRGLMYSAIFMRFDYTLFVLGFQ